MAQRLERHGDPARAADPPGDLAGPLWPLPIVWGTAAMVVVAAAVAFGYNPASSSTWARFDSFWYESIARDGYLLSVCPPDAWSGPGSWCGNAGWFPGYPWVLRALHLVGLPIAGTAVAVSWAFIAATIVLIWCTFLGRRRTPGAFVVLLYAAFAPGQIYHYAIFPMSMLAFFTVAFLWFLTRERWLAAGLCGAAAAMAYPLGVLLAPVAVAWLVISRGAPLVERFRNAVCVAGLTTMGVAAVVLAAWYGTGRWNAYFLVQQKYDHGLQDPVTGAWASIRPLLHGPLWAVDNAPALQTALVTVALIAVLTFVVRQRHSVTRAEVLIVVWAVCTWALPLSQGNLTVSRSQAALLPLAVLFTRLPRVLAGALLVAAVGIAVAMETLFLNATLL